MANAQHSPERRYVSIDGAAKHFDVSRATIRRAVIARDIPSLKVGRQYRLDLAELEALFSRPAVHTPGGITAAAQRRARSDRTLRTGGTTAETSSNLRT